MNTEVSISRRCLILAPGFNCDGQAASQTVTDKIPYLEAAGYELEVVGSLSGNRHNRLPHYQVWPWSPSGIRNDYRFLTANRYGRGPRYRLQTVAVSIFLSPFILMERMLTGLSGHWSWAPAAALKAWLLHRKKPFDLIYSSGGPISAHLAGWMAHKLTGLPWIAEVHDPIVASTQATSLRVRLSRQKYLERLLEKLVCKDANVVWWFTNAALTAARRRNPQLADRGFSVLPGVKPPKVVKNHVYGEYLNIGYFGKLSHTRSLNEFLQGLNVWIENNPKARAVIRLHVYGTKLDEKAKLTAEQFNLWDMIVRHGRIERDAVTGESGRTQVTSKMQQCDALLLLLGNDPSFSEYIPSKIYEYLWAKRPVLGLIHQNLQLDELVERFGGIIPRKMDAQNIANAINIVWDRWKNRTLEPSDATPIGVDVAMATILKHVENATKRANQLKGIRRVLPRIAIIAYKYGSLGGGERFVQELTERIAATGKYELHVFANKWMSQCTSITFHKVPVVAFSVFMRIWGFDQLVGRMIRNGNFDVVHSHWGSSHANVYSLHGAPHVYWVRDILKRRRIKLASRVMFALDRKMIAQGLGKIFMPVSSLLQRTYQSEYGQLPGTWKVVQPGIDRSAFDLLDRKNVRIDLRKKYSIPDSAVVVLFVGMNFETKGLGTVIRAVGLLRSTQPNSPIHILVVGRGNIKKYKQIAAEYGCADAVTFAGPQIQGIERFYVAADVFAIPALYETFCMVVLEAMAAGLPVIISENMGVKDIVQHGVNGFVLPNGDQVSAVTECLNKLSDSKLREAMGAAAYETSKAHSWDYVVTNISAAYEMQLQNNKAVSALLGKTP